MHTLKLEHNSHTIFRNESTLAQFILDNTVANINCVRIKVFTHHNMKNIAPNNVHKMVQNYMYETVFDRLLNMLSSAR